MQQLNLYGTQPGFRPGQANIGYADAGQVYNMANPVMMTTSGIRPASVVAASQRQQQMRPQQPQMPQRAPYAWTAAGRAAAQGGGQMGSGNPLLDQLNGGTVQTSITPQNIYSPQQTQAAVNQAIASSSVPLDWLKSRFAGKGMSVNSPAAISRALVPYSQGLAQGQIASAQIPLQDATANAQHMLAGESARENEGIDWARLMVGAQGINQNARMNTLQSVLGLLGAFV